MTSDDLFAMGMESETAFNHMRELCELAGVQYPPKLQQDTAKREALPDPFLEGVPA